MRGIWLLAAVPLAGCMTSAAAIRDKPVAFQAATAKTVDEVERCIRLSQPGGRTVLRTEAPDGSRELTIEQESAGIVMFVTLRQTEAGTSGVVRKKGPFVNFDDQVEACFQP